MMEKQNGVGGGTAIKLRMEIPNGFKLSSASAASVSSASESSFFNKNTPPFSLSSSSSSNSLLVSRSSPTVITKNGTTTVVLSSNGSSSASNGKKMLLSSSSLAVGDDSVFTSCWSTNKSTSNTSSVTHESGSMTLTSVGTVTLTQRNDSVGSVFPEQSVNEKSSVEESPANTTIFSTGESPTSDVLRGEAEMSDLMDSMIQSAENSIDMFAATPAAKKIREMVTGEADSSESILVPATQPVDEDSLMKCSESKLVVVLDSDEDEASPQSPANRTSVEADDSQDILVPATQACQVSTQNLNGPSVIEDSAVESSFHGAGNLTFTVSPSPMKISTKQLVRSGKNIPLKLAAVTEENSMPFNSTYVMASTYDKIRTDNLRNCTFSRQASSINDRSKRSDSYSTPNSILGEENISSQKEPALFTTLEENSLNCTPLISEDAISENQRPINLESLVVRHDDTKCESGLGSGPLSSVLSRISINTVSNSSPRRGKKSYVEPFFPVKADVDPVPKPAHDTSDSEDEEIIKKKNPAGKLPIHNNVKRGKEAKADREALFEVENPRPSTSAALVRHNAREQKLKAKKKKKTSECGVAGDVSKHSKSNNEKKAKTTIAKKLAPKKKNKVGKKSDLEKIEAPVNADQDEIIPKPVPSAALAQFSNMALTEFRNESPASQHALETANIVSDISTRVTRDEPMGLKMPDLAPAVSAEEDRVIQAGAGSSPELPPPVLKSEVQTSQARKRGGRMNRRIIIEKVKNEEEAETEKLPSLKETPEQEVNHPSAAVPQSIGRPRRKRAAAVVTIDLSDDNNENEFHAKKVKDGPRLFVEAGMPPPTPIKKSSKASNDDLSEVASSRATRPKRDRKCSTDDNGIAQPEAKRSRRGVTVKKNKAPELKISHSPPSPTPPRTRNQPRRNKAVSSAPVEPAIGCQEVRRSSRPKKPAALGEGFVPSNLKRIF